MLSNRYTSFPFLLCLLFSVFATAQNWQFRHFDASDGLAHSTVFRVAPSPDSLCIWFGTDRGVSRFDGTNWDNFALPGKANKSPVLCMVPINYDSIQFGIHKENWFVLKNGELIPKPVHRHSQANLNEIVSYFTDSEAGVWVIDTRQGFFQWGEHHNLIDSWRREPLTFAGGPSAIAEFDGKVFVPHKSGILVFELNQKPPYSILDSLDVFQVLADNNKLWICTRTQILKWENEQLIPVLKLNGFRTLFKDRNDGLWIATADGVFNYKNHKLTHVSKELGLHGIQVNHIAQDFTGNIWWATYKSGVYAVREDPMVQFISSRKKSRYVFNALYKDADGTVWIGSMDHLAKLENDSIVTFPDKQNIQGLVTHFHRQQDGGLFIGTSVSSYVYSCDELKESPTSAVLDYAQTPEGEGLYADFRGAKNEKNQRIVTLPQECLQNTITALLPTDTLLLLGSFCGIWTLKGIDLAKWQQLQPLQNAEIQSLQMVDKDRLLVASSVGLYSYHHGIWNSCETRFGEKVSGNCILQAQNGTIWVGTDDGLFTLEQGNRLERFPFYGKNNSNTIYSLSELDSNFILLGSLDYLAQINVNKTDESVYPAKIKIEELKVDNEIVNPDNPILGKGKKNMVIRFKAIDLNEHTDFRYQYKLSRNSSNYTEEKDVSNVLFFHQMEPGDYVLSIDLMDQPSAGATLRFTIQKYWWQSSWGVLLGILFFLAFGFLSYKVGSLIFHHIQSKKRKQLLQIVSLKQKALNAMMNPHFIFNALNSIQHYVNQNEQGKSGNYLEKFAQLIRLNLEQAQYDKVPISEEIERLNLYCSLEKLRFDHPFELKVINTENLDLDDIEIPPLMLQPFVENAILHGIFSIARKGIIRVEFSMISKNILHVTIVDNGVGINARKKGKSGHNSIAIQLIKERLLLQEGSLDIKIEDLSERAGNLSGTSVQLRMQI